MRIEGTEVSGESEQAFTILKIFHTELLDADPGYTITGESNGWEYGVPDTESLPSAASSGVNCYAARLSGSCYADTHLTSTELDCRDYRDVTLNFKGFYFIKVSFLMVLFESWSYC